MPQLDALCARVIDSYLPDAWGLTRLAGIEDVTDRAVASDLVVSSLEGARTAMIAVGLRERQHAELLGPNGRTMPGPEAGLKEHLELLELDACVSRFPALSRTRRSSRRRRWYTPLRPALGGRRGNETCQKGRSWTCVDVAAPLRLSHADQSISRANKSNLLQKRRGRDSNPRQRKPPETVFEYAASWMKSPCLLGS